MKRILSWVLAMVLLLSCVPIGAVRAESLEETLQPQSAPEAAVVEETTLPQAYSAVTAEAADLESLDNEQLLEGYAYSLFYGQIATFGRKAGDQLTGDEKLIYDALVPIIKQIAAGDRTSTVIGLGQTVNYGDTQYVADVPVTFTGGAADNDALTRILTALLTDLPYELYWYDKVTGAKSFALSSQGGVVVHFQLTLAVADNYQGSGEYTVNSSEAQAAVTAAQKSAAIVDKYASASDYEKLVGYKDEICALVTYDHTAANTGNFSLDNDPWQLICVFDGNTATNVVCEGYSKAFMYLCEQTDFAGDVSCITVSGIMGGAHMWNIVTLEGKNYLVDVTNSEPGTVGDDGSLFLAGGTGSVLNGYTVGGYSYSYVDDPEETDPDIALWGSDASSILTLAAENYTPKTITVVASGTCGDNLTWTLDEAGTLTISGTGAMANYNTSNRPWNTLTKSIRKVLLGSGVTTVGKYAFYKCTKLTSVTIPDSIITIGYGAFYMCTGLTSVTIPDSVTTIGTDAFYSCNGLVSVTIGHSVTQIGDNAFWCCEGLTSVIIPDSVTTISDLAFYGCTGLTSVIIPDGVEIIGGESFASCTGLQSITIPDSVTQMGDYAFCDCTGLTSVTIGNGVTAIADCTFMGCTNLDSVIIGNSVTTIGDCVFYECADLTTVTMPNSVTTIGYGAFSDCAGLKDVYYGSTKTQWQQVVIGEENECLTNATIHYGGAHEHTYTKKVVKPTATAQGYTLYTCSCGDSYKADYVLLKPTVSITLNATSGKQVLSWNAIGGASSYYVYRSTSKTGTYTKEGHTKSTTWTDTGAAVGTKYYYKLKAVASGRSSGYSNLVAKAAKCAVPTITVTVKSGRPYISWGKVSGAAKYAVYYSTSKTGTYKKLVTTKKNYYAHSDAATGSQYFYKVKCVAASTSYDSGYSSIKSCNIKCAKLAVTATNDAATGYPVLTWKAVTGAQKYAVYRSLSGKNAYEKIGTTTAKTYTDKKATVNKKYDYQVQALGSISALNSSKSTKDTIICKVAAPVISVKINGSGKPVVSWKAVKGAKSYTVYRSTSATKNYKKYTGGKLDVKKCTFTDTAVSVGKTYYYKVVAVGTGNESAYSNYKKATGTCATPSVTVKLSSNKPVLKWAKVTGAKKYEIQYSTDGKTFKKLTTTTKTSYTHKAKKGTYYYKVKALGSKSSYDSALSAATKAVKVK